MTRNQAIYMSHLFIASEEFATSNKNKTELFGRLSIRALFFLFVYESILSFIKNTLLYFYILLHIVEGKLRKLLRNFEGSNGVTAL